MNTSRTSWQDNCSTITSALTYMLHHERIVDAVFKKDKVSCLFAHKLVLAVWSPIFADMIAEIDEKQMLSITFEEDEDVVKMILQYLYCPDDVDCFAKLPTEKLIQALEFSERYNILHVYKKCLSALRRKNVNPSNVIDFFDFGLRKRFDGIIQKCIKVFATKGINVKLIREDFSVTTLRNLLSLDTIAINSEAELLALAVSWLSYHGNECYKSDVLSLIDLQSIRFTEYQDICMRYPNFFSDDELSAIFLSQLRQDPKLLPKWYKPRIQTVVKSKCSLCMYIHKNMRILKPLQFLDINSSKDLKYFSQKFEFQFPQLPQVKLLKIELNFGPREISPKEFTLRFRLGRNVQVQNYYVNTSKFNEKYKVVFNPPLTLKSKNTLTLQFYFRRGLLANNIHIIRPIIYQLQPEFSAKDEYNLHLTSSEQAFYRSSDLSDKFIVSSFHLNVCDSHCIYLYRKCIDVCNEMNLDHEISEELETMPYNMDVKKGIISVKKEVSDDKMEIDDKNQNCCSKVNLKTDKPFTKKETVSFNSPADQQYGAFKIADSTTNLKNDKPFIKKEIISFDSPTDEQYTTFKIVDEDEMTHKIRILKSEVIDLADEL